MSPGVICGFWDEAAGLAGLGWELGGSSGAVLLGDGKTSPATASIAEGGRGLTLRADGIEASAELDPGAGAARLGGAAENGGAEAASCAAEVKLGGRRLRCRGQLTNWSEDPAAGAEVLRHLALPAADGGLLIVIARAPAGAGSHAEESGSAWLLDSGGRAGAYPEAFLSTQYDGDERPTRAGLEVWSEDLDAPPVRAAGTALGDPAQRVGCVDAAFIRSSVEGTEGLGSYLIWRAA